jgi:hypothetical protein
MTVTNHNTIKTKFERRNKNKKQYIINKLVLLLLFFFYIYLGFVQLV